MRSLFLIAEEIEKNWKDVNFAAVPYLKAMYQLDKITDNYICDTGRSVVSYFLSNASTWRGAVARRIKAELKEMLKK